MREILVALAGNPNVGKTAIFNSLTGTRQKVANWPGVTVERKEGICEHRGYKFRIVDLPGIYSLTAFSVDELIARNFIVEEQPDIVVNVVDASQLERNLYLTIQLLEMDVKLIVVLNMIDIARQLGYKIEYDTLSSMLGVPVIPTIASKGIGIDRLKDTMVDLVEGNIKVRPFRIDYGGEIENAIAELKRILEKDAYIRSKYSLRWLAIKLLEMDKDVMKKLSKSPIFNELVKTLEHIRQKLG